MMSIIILSVVMLIVIIPNVFELIVLAPFKQCFTWKNLKIVEISLRSKHFHPSLIFVQAS
jgi:hypothetical protein